MYKAFKFRIYPTSKQKELINKHIGCTRLIYNLALDTKKIAYAKKRITLSAYDLIKQLPELKQAFPWLKEINSQSLQASILNLDNAFKNFSDGYSEYPKHKSKSRGSLSFQVPQNVAIKNGKLSIPKFTEGIEIVMHRKIKGKIKSATVSKTRTGKYFVSILCDTGENCKPKPMVNKENIIGIDLGLKNYVTASAGWSVEPPEYLRKSELRLKYIQRRYSKHNGKRTKNKLAKLHEKIANQRNDFLHKLSSQLVSNNQAIAVEDLHVKGMLKNHNLAKSISDASWSTFIRMLSYKFDWYGVNLIPIDRFEPSSKRCSTCGEINHKLALKDREWTCAECKTKHDRDINAAINIKNYALQTVSGTDTENQGELPSLEGVTTPEAQPSSAELS